MIVPKFSTDSRSDCRLQKRSVLTVDFSLYNMRNGVFAVLMDGSVLTLAGGLRHSSKLANGISMAVAEACRMDGSLTSRGSPWLGAAITGLIVTPLCDQGAAFPLFLSYDFLSHALVLHAVLIIAPASRQVAIVAAWSKVVHRPVMRPRPPYRRRSSRRIY
jgi:hypothetical protein